LEGALLVEQTVRPYKSWRCWIKIWNNNKPQRRRGRRGTRES